MLHLHCAIGYVYTRMATAGLANGRRQERLRGTFHTDHFTSDFISSHHRIIAEQPVGCTVSVLQLTCTALLKDALAF